tara:strand:- start:42 stop:551 length:510 start_codon:yes stop_codon:yes gene_type:complete
MGDFKKGNRYSIEFKKQVCEYSVDNSYADTAKKFGVHYNSIKDWRKALGYPNLGSGYRLGFGEEIQIEACKMYMSNPSMTKQEVCDIYNTSTYSLGQWLRKHGFSMKVAKRKPLPTKSDRIARNFKVLQTEHNKVKAELMQLKESQHSNNSWISDKLIDIAQAIVIRSN